MFALVFIMLIVYHAVTVHAVLLNLTTRRLSVTFVTQLMASVLPNTATFTDKVCTNSQLDHALNPGYDRGIQITREV